MIRINLLRPREAAGALEPARDHSLGAASGRPPKAVSNRPPAAASSRPPDAASSRPPEAASSRLPEAASSRWMSRGEVWTGAALLAMGAAVLAYLISLPKAPAPTDSRPAPAPAAQVPPVTAGASTPEPVAAAPAPPAPAPAPVETIPASKPAAKPAPPPAQVTPAPPPASGVQVSGISIRRRPGALLVAIEVEPGVKYRSMELTNPSRLVLDLADCRLVMPVPLQTQAVTSPYIQRVRAGQYRRDPAICRIVLDAATLPRYQIRPAPRGLEIQIADGGR